MRNGAQIKPFGILWGFRREIQYEMFRPEDLPPLWKLLTRKLGAGTDGTILKRIEYFAETFRISDIMTRRYHAFGEADRLMKDRARPGKVLASLLQHAKDAPAFDLESHIRRVWGELPCAYSGNGQPKRAVKALHYIFDAGPWQTVAEMVRAGERNPSKLSNQAKSGLSKMAPAGHETDAAAKDFMCKLFLGAERVASAKRAKEPPVIDGITNESCWTWNDQRPWFSRDSADTTHTSARFAWAYDQEHLYLGLAVSGTDCGHEQWLGFFKSPRLWLPSLELSVCRG